MILLASVMALCHVQFCAVASFKMLRITTLWRYSRVFYTRLVCLILSPSLNIYYGLTEGTNMWFFILFSHGCTMHFRFFQALGRALRSVIILDVHINFGLIVDTRMPPRRGQSRTERVNKRHHAMDSSTASDSLV